MSIEWALFLIDFLSKVMLPRFGRLKEMVGFGAGGDRHHHLVASMMEDVAYRDYVRDALFLHAAADPMTLRKALTPGQDEASLRAYFDPCWRELSFHSSLWKVLQKARRRGAIRAVRQLVRTGVLRSDGRACVPKPAAPAGPPASWMRPPLTGVAGVRSGRDRTATVAVSTGVS